MKMIAESARKFGMMSVLSSIVALSGCTVTTEQLSDGDRLDRSEADLAKMFAGQDKVTGPITLGEAIARSLKYNLDHRAKKMETVLAERDYDFNKLDLLPDLTVRAGYSDRSNLPAASSQDVETGEISLPTSISTEEIDETSGIELTWNILDFGISYYTAKQASDRVFIAEERRRKTVQNITQDVVDAFWKAWMGQSLEPRIAALIEETQIALEASRDLVRRGAQDPQDALSTQSGMLNTLETLYEMRERIDLGKIRLAALMNLAPGTDYEVAPPSSMALPAPLAGNMDSMVQQALLQRPELREEDYQRRITYNDTRKAMLSMFPSLELKAGSFHDDNRFLLNNDWQAAGYELTWNLLGIFSAHAEKQYHEAALDVADVRRMALSMAVMTQVHLASSRYEIARNRYQILHELYAIQSEEARQSRAQGSRASGMEQLGLESKALASELRKNLAYAETQAALARVANALGVDPVPGQVGSYGIATLGVNFDEHWAKVVKGTLMHY